MIINLDRNDTEISIMENSSGVQSGVTSSSQDENMNTPDKMEMDSSSICHLDISADECLKHETDDPTPK